MINRIIKETKLSIIEKGVVLKAYEILQQKYGDIIAALNNRYEATQKGAMKNIATIMAWFEEKNRYDKRIYQGYFLDFLDRKLAFNFKDELYNDIKYKSITDAIESTLYRSIVECEVGCMLFFLGEYAEVVCGLGERGLSALICIFDRYFTVDSTLKTFFNIANFIESAEWSEWKTEDVIALGRPYLSQVDENQILNTNTSDLKKSIRSWNV